MAGIVNLETALWVISAFSEAGLLVLLLYRRNYKTFPAFFAYVLVNFAQSAILFASYRVWGFNSSRAVTLAWGAQGLVIAARTLAVGEICRRVLAGYRGIWALAWRMLLAVVTLLLVYSAASARLNWQLAVLYADRGLELAIAVAIVTLFLFVRYYEIEVEPAARSLAIGFLIYSCSSVLNNTILESWMHRYATLWNVLNTFAFMASLSLWMWALRETRTETTSAPELLSGSVYGSLAPEINLHLKTLNKHLSQWWYVEAKRP